MKKLHIAQTGEVRAGDVTDVYFIRTEEVLRSKKASRHVCMEIFLKSWPDHRYRWGIFAGLEEACILLEEARSRSGPCRREACSSRTNRS